jgi:signal transduction histidine kinase/HAMP domain-containing protein
VGLVERPRGIRFGVRGKLIVLVLAVLVPLLVLQSVGVYDRLRRHRAEEMEESRVYAGAVATVFSNYLESQWDAELAIGSAIAFARPERTAAEIEAFLHSQLPEYPTVRVFSWVDPTGTVLASTEAGAAGEAVADRPYFRALVEGKDRSVSDLLLGQFTGTPMVVEARAIRSGDKLIGVVQAGIDLDALSQVLPASLGVERSYGLVDQSGSLVYRCGTAPESKPNMGSSVPIGDIGWAAFTNAPVSNVMAEARSDALRGMTEMLLLAAISVGASLVLGGRLVGRVQALQEAARAISEGNLSARVHLGGNDELTATAHAFDLMAQRVQQADEDQKARVSAVAGLGEMALAGAGLERLAAEAAQVVARGLGVPHAAVMELLPGDGGFRWLAQTGWSDPQSAAAARLLGLALARRTMAQASPLIVENLADDSALLAEPGVAGLGVVSCIAVVIPGPERPFGVLGACSPCARRTVPSDLHFLEAVANEMATAIERNRILAAQGFLAEAGTLLAASLDYETTLNNLAQLVVSHMADTCAVHMQVSGSGLRRMAFAHRDAAKGALIRESAERHDPHGHSLADTAFAQFEQQGPALIAEVTEETLCQVARSEAHLATLRALAPVSVMMVPLMAGGRVLGSIAFVSGESGRRYGPADLALAEELARRASLAVDHARLYQETREAVQERDRALERVESMAADLRVKAHQQAAVADLGRGLIAGGDLAAVMAAAVQTVAEVLETDFCSLMEFMPGGQSVVVRESVGWTRGVVGPPEMVPPGAVSGVSVGIGGQAAPYGVLSTHACVPRAFTEDDVTFLQAVAHTVGAAVDNTRDRRRLTTQHAVATVLADLRGEEESAPRVLEAICQGLGWDLGVLWIADPAAAVLRCAEIWQDPNLTVAEPFVAATWRFAPRRGEGVIGQAWAAGQPVWVANLHEDPTFVRKDVAAATGIRTGFWFPILLGQEVHGMIECFTRESWQPDQQMLGTASAIGTQIGQFMQRRRAEEELRRLNVELEQRVAARTAELAAANQELEAFASSVSHDLRAPLRTIDGFGQALQEDCGDKLPPEGHDSLRRIREAARQMSGLIDDLLRLSRMVRSELRRERTDLSRIAQAILLDLQKAAPERTVTVTIAGGLTAYGDERLLRVALENLLANAWKFTSRRPDARIEFGAKRQDGERVFFVRDNGAGFDMAFATKLFGPFQRLHKQTEFEGNGIGLATVYRIIQRHGGRVWAEAAVDRGATFYFTLLQEEAGGDATQGDSAGGR